MNANAKNAKGHVRMLSHHWLTTFVFLLCEYENVLLVFIELMCPEHLSLKTKGFGPPARP